MGYRMGVTRSRQVSSDLVTLLSEAMQMFKNAWFWIWFSAVVMVWSLLLL